MGQGAVLIEMQRILAHNERESPLQASINIKRPRTDDRRVWDVVFGVYGFPAILLAHKLKLFPLLANRPRSLPQVCEALGIKRRPTEAILAAA
jgi:hypothetical protein